MRLFALSAVGMLMLWLIAGAGEGSNETINKKNSLAREFLKGRIAEIREYPLNFEEQTEPEEDYLKSIVRYNKEGNKVERIGFDINGDTSAYLKIDYNSEGLAISEYSVSNGRVSNITHEYKDKKVPYKTTCSGFSMNQTVYYQYNDDDDVVGMKANPEDTFTIVNDYEYYDNGRKKKSVQGREGNLTINEFDENGNCIEQIFESREMRFVRVYDENNVIKESSDFWEDSLITERRFDKSGNIVEEIRYSECRGDTTHFEYDFDAKHNWIRKRIYNINEGSKKLMGGEIRKIKYY